MPVSRDDVLALLDSEEPDYRAAAIAVGVDGLEVLATLVEDADASLAARAASLVAAIAMDSAAAQQTVPLLASAAEHADPGVRAAAALGASRVGAAAVSVITTCLADDDAGVRLIAFRGLSVPLDASVAAAVSGVAAADPEPAVKDKAAAIVARSPDPALGNELLAGALDYARARLADLREAALLDVPSFSAAFGIGGFVDLGGLVAGLLAAARAALDRVAPRMAARDYTGAATEVGNALRAISDAAAALGGGASLPALLGAKINWAAAVPAGLAKQLGLPASVPALAIDGGALVYQIGAPARVLIAAPPLKLGFDKAQLSARLRMDGGSPPLDIDLNITGIEASVGGGPIASLVGGDGGSVHADVVLGVNTEKGLTLGGAGARVVLPARPKVGPLDLREIVLELPPGSGNTIDVGSTITADIGGIITATIDGAGLHIHIDSAAASRGNNPLSVSLKAPDRHRARASTPASCAAAASSNRAAAAMAARCSCDSGRWK